MKEIYVIGSEGYIGTKLYNRLIREYKVNRVDLEADINLDLCHPELFDFDILNSDTIIFTAAMSSPDICEKNFEMAYNINVIGTIYFITEAIKHNCKVLFFSSDAVFGFNKEIVNEHSETSGDTAYGKMKKKVEDYFKDNSLFKAIRLSYVFSKYDRYTSYLVQCSEENSTAEIYHPFYRNVVTIDDVIDVVHWLIENWMGFDNPFLNVCGKELVSRVRIADEIIRYTGLKLDYKIKYPGNEFYKNRPAILEMQSIYIDQILDSGESFYQKVKKQLKKEEL